MKNTNILGAHSEVRITRILTLSIIGVASLLMCSLALTASAATLSRQLQFGMSGQDVSDLQSFLAQDNTIYPQGLVTGYFGLLTQSAVSNFQARNGISTVGRVGPITLSAINQQMNTGMNSGADRAAPIITSLNINTTNSSATFSWNTSKNSAAIIYYDTAPLYMIEGSPTSAVTIGGTSFLVNTDLRVSHSGTITNLQSNTTYYYVVYVRDGSGNENITWPSTFHTN
jgi:peptidoglycan hydrolase-like protein with peptidoglycan-binding domain